jgi:hypothetical protein
LTQVPADKPWDIKKQKSWDGTIGSTWPDDPNTRFLYHGSLYTREELGNYTFGYIGAALDFPLGLLYAGSWYAAKMPTFNQKFLNAEISDWEYVKIGYNAFHNDFK